MATLQVFQFTYAADGQYTVQSMLSVRHLYPDATLTVIEQSTSPLDDTTKAALASIGCIIETSEVNRKGNLNGKDFLTDELNRFNASTCDVIMKLDADTILTKDILTPMLDAGKDAQFVGKDVAGLAAYGVCYLIKRSRIPSMIAEWQLWLEAYDTKRHYGEDRIIYGLCMHVFPSKIQRVRAGIDWMIYPWYRNPPPHPRTLVLGDRAVGRLTFKGYAGVNTNSTDDSVNFLTSFMETSNGLIQGYYQ